MKKILKILSFLIPILFISYVSVAGILPAKEEYLKLNNQNFGLLITPGSTRAQIVTITNTMAKPISVNIVADNWIRAEPNIFILEPNEIKSVILTITVMSYSTSQKKEGIINLKTNKGKNLKIKVLAFGSLEKLK